MKRAIADLLAALLVRAVPGLLNLGALVLIARRLTHGDFGFYSTIVATAVLISVMSFGVFYTPFVSQYSAYKARSRHGALVGTLALSSAAVAILLAVAGGLALVVRRYPYELVALTIAMGLHATFQEVLRAKMAVLAYGFSDFLQASFLVALLFGVPTVEFGEVARLHALSYLLPILFSGSLALRGLRLSGDWRVAREILRPGAWLVLGTATENLLLLGARYLLILFGSPTLLGQFAFAVDLAQRSIGFVINATGFIYLPKAFSALAASGPAAFRATLLRGSAIATGLGFCGVAFVVVAAIIAEREGALPTEFAPATFALVGGAVVANRLKKLLVEPFALRVHRTRFLVLANLVGGSVGLLASGVALWAGWSAAMPVGYLMGYLSIVVLSLAPFYRDIMDSQE